MSTFTNHAISFLVYVLLGYIVLILIFFLFADLLIYQPPRTQFVPSESTHTIQVGHEKIKATYLKAPNARFTLLYSHGNAEDLGTIMPVLKLYQKHGYSVFAYDYEGYGLSSGHPSEHNLYRDASAAYDYMVNTLRIPAHEIVLYGRSLGSGPTMELATHKPVAGVILEAPFITAFRAATQIPIMPYDKFKNIDKVNKINAPLLVMHGKRDSVIPFWHGRTLYDAALPPKKSFWIESADHNNIIEMTGDTYWKELAAFMKMCSETNKPST